MGFYNETYHYFEEEESKCVVCPNAEDVALKLTFGLLVLLVVVLLVRWFLRSPPGALRFLSSFVVACGTTLTHTGLQAKLKMAIGFYQVRRQGGSCQLLVAAD